MSSPMFNMSPTDYAKSLAVATFIKNNIAILSVMIYIIMNFILRGYAVYLYIIWFGVTVYNTINNKIDDAFMTENTVPNIENYPDDNDDEFDEDDYVEVTIDTIDTIDTCSDTTSDLTDYKKAN